MDSKPSKLRFTALALVAIASVAVVGAVLWLSGAWSNAVWTDGRSINASAGATTPRDILWTSPEKIPTTSTPELDHYEPRLNWDGSTLYFAVGRPETRDEFSSIWMIDREPQGWSIARQLESMESPSNNIGAEPSKDERAIYFSSDRDGGYGGFDLWVMSRDEDGAWNDPVNLGPTVNSSFDEYSPALTPQSTRLFFASNRPAPDAPPPSSLPTWPATVRENIERNGFDLFVAPINDGAVGESRPIDPVNTAANEGTPAVTPFGDFLYFASDRDGGSGGFDLHRVRLLGNDGFGDVERLSDQINTEWNELDPGLGMGGHELVFSSDRPGPESSDNGLSRIYSSFAREVYLVQEPANASFGWFWWLLWLLMLLFALLLLLFLLRRLMVSNWSGRMRKLGLLAQCLLLSLLAHALLMLALTVWQITASVGDSLRGTGATKVALTTSAGSESSGLTSQLMSTAVGVDIAEAALDRISPTFITIEAPAPVPAEQLSQSIPITTDATPVPMDQPTLASTQPPTVMRDLPEFSTDIPETQNDPLPSTISSPIVEAAQSSTEPTLEIASAQQPNRERTTSELPSVQSGAPSPPRTLTANTERPSFESDTSRIQIPSVPAPQLSPEPLARSFIAATIPSSAASSIAVDVGLPDQPEARSSGSTPEIQFTSAAPTVTTIDRPQISARMANTTVSRLNAPIELDLHTAPRALIEPSRLQPGETQLPNPTRNESRLTPSPSSEISPLSLDLPGDTVRAPETQLAESSDIQIDSAHIAQSQQRSDPIGLLQLQPNAAPTPALTIDSSPRDTLRESATMFEEIDPAASEMHLERPLASLNIPIEAPAFTPSLPDLSIPTEVAPPVDAFTQRDEEVREDVVEAMGGSRETERAVAMAMDWLSRHQSANGRWDSNNFDPQRRQGGRSRVDCDVAVTGLALLVFLGADQTHLEDGPYRESVDNGLRWLLTQLSRSGDIRNGETMYSQGIATIALCEAYGMSGDARLREPAQRAIEFIVEAQGDRDNGWRYEPGMAGDTSVLGWQVMAMISARKVGLEVPQRALDRAAAWLNGVSRPGAPGLYAYQRHKAPTMSMTAEGMFVRQLLGTARGEPMMAQSAAFIGRHTPDWQNAANTYAWYYATLALFQRQGAEWERWNEALAAELVGAQRQDGPAQGSWDTADQWSRVGGRVYQTAICALSLEVYYRYLPLYITDVSDADGE